MLRQRLCFNSINPFFQPVIEEDDEEFMKQLEMALKLSLNEAKPDSAAGTHPGSSKTAPASKNKKNKFKKFRDSQESEKEKNVRLLNLSQLDCSK
jgi:hypothetical protein